MITTTKINNTFTVFYDGKVVKEYPLLVDPDDPPDSTDYYEYLIKQSSCGNFWCVYTDFYGGFFDDERYAPHLKCDFYGIVNNEPTFMFSKQRNYFRSSGLIEYMNDPATKEVLIMFNENKAKLDFYDTDGDLKHTFDFGKDDEYLNVNTILDENHFLIESCDFISGFGTVSTTYLVSLRHVLKNDNTSKYYPPVITFSISTLKLSDMKIGKTITYIDETHEIGYFHDNYKEITTRIHDRQKNQIHEKRLDLLQVNNNIVGEILSTDTVELADKYKNCVFEIDQAQANLLQTMINNRSIKEFNCYGGTSGTPFYHYINKLFSIVNPADIFFEIAEIILNGYNFAHEIGVNLVYEFVAATSKVSLNFKTVLIHTDINMPDARKDRRITTNTVNKMTIRIY